MSLLEFRPVNRTTKDPSTYSVHADNGKEIGLAYREVDGYFVFWPDKGSQGFWAASHMREIADKLDELNKEWDAQVQRDLGPEGVTMRIEGEIPQSFPEPDVTVHQVESPDGPPYIQFRPHSGSLDESMAHCVRILATVESIRGLFLDQAIVQGAKILVQLYADEPDTRINWDRTYIVEIEGYGVLGFTDGPLWEKPDGSTTTE